MSAKARKKKKGLLHPGISYLEVHGQVTETNV